MLIVVLKDSNIVSVVEGVMEKLKVLKVLLLEGIEFNVFYNCKMLIDIVVGILINVFI